MLTLGELNEQDFESFTEHLENIVYGKNMAAALWDHKPFVSIEHLVSEMSGIIHSLPVSGILVLLIIFLLQILFLK